MSASAARGAALPAAVAAAATLLLSGCTGPPTPAPEVTAVFTSEAVAVAEGLDAPWSIAFHGSTALVSERDTGTVVEIGTDGGVREVAVLDGVVAGGEGGLLGLAVHDGYLYAYATADEGNRVERHELRGTPGSLRLGPAEPILSGIPSAPTHNGGRIAFGPDGRLYVTTGDAGDGRRAQDPQSLAGKILRVEADGTVPSDNPFPGSPVYSLGHRNPQGLAWADDGTLFASEFGQNTWDELNVVVPGGNYGWPEVEGIAEKDGFVDPVQQWAPADASPSGITVVQGRLLIANLRGERLREVPVDDLGSSAESGIGRHGRLRDVVVAPDGEVWILTNNTDGRGSPREGDDRILAVEAE
ncbi:PQQ-dependent sugar dehydrogenase [Microbacterium paraoxydans]|uniref:PQQ-dependent sugar dehydrogenase n=1 Tax=Microbacterium paraoxydans TaxID=199592 RepID=A0ABS5IPE9_9MICO|nr:PQQ-dependent sugar dehydrogenase [Microbacterium paraoxydans]MBS0024833.1 PQQ-dependent sugar dehydrogenase [Microbacterium paraoxydans]